MAASLTSKGATVSTTTKLDPKDIAARAMLVRLDLSMWEARKHDAKITDETNQRHKAGKHAGRYHKHLFGGPVAELSAVVTAHHDLRWTHICQTLPWSDKGDRLLPTANVLEYAETIRKKTAVFDEAAEVLVEAYPRLRRQARELLNGMYNGADYPTDIRDKFGVEVTYKPLPLGSDFRVDLPTELVAKMAKSNDEQLIRTVTEAMGEAWARLGEAVTELREKLKGEPKHLRQSMFDRIKELAETLGRLNVTQDPALDARRAEVVASLGDLKIDAVKADEIARNAAKKEADAILKRMAGFYKA